MSKLSIAERHRIILSAAGGTWFDFEGLVLAIYSEILRPGDFALDIGVNDGVHFENMSNRIGRNGLIVGVEAIPDLANAVMWRSALFQSSCVLYNVAVSNYDGRAKFNWVKDATGLSSLAVRGVAAAYKPERIEVPVTTIDMLIAGIKRPIAFAKMDIEGAEFHAMQKGLRIFKDRSPIVFEFDRDTPNYFEYNADDLIAFMAHHGYEIYDFFGNTFLRGADLLESGVWNYYAQPKGKLTGSRVSQIVAAALKKNGIALPRMVN